MAEIVPTRRQCLRQARNARYDRVTWRPGITGDRIKRPSRLSNNRGRGDPTKLIEIVGLGKQLLMTRGALTTFSISNDVAKYFAILPAIFIVLYPGLGALNVMQLGSPESAILSAIIFNALIIPALVPLALKGVRYRPASAGSLLARNLAIYGAGGLLAPFIGIKIIDMAVNGLHLA